MCAALCIATLVLPAFASAATISELRVLIDALTAQIQALQNPPTNSCIILKRNLSAGSHGNDVATLQHFLIAQKLLSADSATAYFGKLTQKAVEQWQIQNNIVSNGSPSSTGFGAVGPKTRKALADCRPKNDTPPRVSSSTPQTSATTALPHNGGDSGGGGGGSSQRARPTVTLTQSKEVTSSNGSTGEEFTISWNASDATTCTVQKRNPLGTVQAAWATGTAGSQKATAPAIGKHQWWVDCTGPGGSAHAELTHTVINSKPNIVVIMTDDMRVDDLSVMPKTKRLIGDQGITFSNSFVDYSICCPSRASFLTGQSAHNSGVMGNTPNPVPQHDGGFTKFKPTQHNALPVWLQNAGYVTAHMGKYLNGFSGADGIPPGWTLWNGIADDQGAYKFYGYTINDNGTSRYYGSAMSDYKTDVQAKRAADFLTSASSSAFLWLAPLAPHASAPEMGVEYSFDTGPDPAPRHIGTFSWKTLPVPAHFNEADMSDKPLYMQALHSLSAGDIQKMTDHYRRRQESLLAVDDMVERVVNALEASGKLQNTYVIFTSDNGLMQGEHRRTGAKYVAYEDSIRVPLLIRGPGIPAGVTRTQLVNNLDLVATIEEVSGAAPGRTPDGKSLIPLFSNPEYPWRSTLLIHGEAVNRNAYYTAPLNSKPGFLTAVRTANLKYIENQSDDGSLLEKELYILTSDPYELENKAYDPGYASVVGHLAAKLNSLKSCIGSGCFMTDPEPRFSAPTVSISQSKTQTSSDGTTAETFQVAWISENASACVVQKTNPAGALFNPWASGTSGSQDAAPPMIGSHHWWVDCSGPGGSAHADMYHIVVQSDLSSPR